MRFYSLLRANDSTRHDETFITQRSFHIDIDLTHLDGRLPNIVERLVSLPIYYIFKKKRKNLSGKVDFFSISFYPRRL